MLQNPQNLKSVFVGPIRKPRIKYGSQKSAKPKKKKSMEEPFPAVKSVDYVLVYKKSYIDDDAFNKIESFVHNLEEKGFELEATTFSGNKDVNFIKIHAPEAVLIRYAELFGIELAFRSVQYNVRPSKPNKCMATEVSRPRILGPIYARARETLSGERPKAITSAEKGLIIFNVLRRNAFGEFTHDCGIEKLIKQQVIEVAYPLHDGPFEWTQQGPLNDRQILKKYWSNFSCWYKRQPLDLIEKYFGPETGLYFAWLGFYNKMLMVASIVAIVFFLLGVGVFYDSFTTRSKEVCESNLYLCPRCLYAYCRYEPLQTQCTHSRLIYVFANPFVIIFAGIMSVWSTLFVELWHRKEAMLQIRWNIRGIKWDYAVRAEFEEGTTKSKISPITGNLVPYMAKDVLCYRYTVTFVVVLLVMLLVGLGLFGVMLYIKTVSVILTKFKMEGSKVNPSLVASFTGTILSLVFIMLVDTFYSNIAMKLTKMENPRTQVDFDNAFIYKSYAIAFVNNYAVIFYLAFLKTRFYTYPGDEKLFNVAGGIASDLCHPTGCTVELGIQLIITLSGKRLLSTILQYIKPRIGILIKKCSKKAETIKVIHQWESDYMLNAVSKYHIMAEQKQMVMQYGFIMFFVAAFPLAPVIALINNLVELRIDASNLTRAFRRPVAVKVPSIGAWDGILRGVTYIGVATNAFVIAFTTEFVQREVYIRYFRKDLKGFVNSTMSAYNVSKFRLSYDKNISECYYPGQRYPPGHEKEYHLTDDYWFNLTFKFLAVVIFEHVVMIISGLIAFIIPDVPFSVKEHINYHKTQLQEIKLKHLRETDGFVAT